MSAMTSKRFWIFSGSIAGVTGFGVFVALDDIYVEGLVHVTDLGDEYFHFDAAKHQMLGERSGTRFRLGDRLQVKVARVDLETSRVDFSLVKEEKRPAAAPAKPRAARPARTEAPKTRGAANTPTPKAAAAPRRKVKPKSGLE